MTSRPDFIVFGAPLIGQEEIDEVVSTLKSGWIGTGPKAAQFEREFCEFKNCKFGVAVSSCTAALHLSLIAAGVGFGDEVIAPAMTFCSTVNAIIHTGATPVLVDVNPTTYLIDINKVEAAVTSKTKAIIPVHYAGHMCEMSALVSLALHKGLVIIEDCAHAIESHYRGSPAGTIGDFGCFSFYSTKNITCAEGGLVLAKSEEAISRIKALALHGMTKDAWQRFGDDGYKHYQVVECGFKYNMTDIQASIAIHQLRRIEKLWLRRSSIWHRYRSELSNLPIGIPVEPTVDSRHAFHLFPIEIDKKASGISRDEFIDLMTNAGIGVGVHYVSLAEHPYYKNRFGWRPEDFPHAFRYGSTTVSLPLSPKLSDDDVTRVILEARRVFG